MHENPLVIFPLLAWSTLSLWAFYWAMHQWYRTKNDMVFAIGMMPLGIVWFVGWIAGTAVLINLIGDTPMWEAFILTPFICFGFMGALGPALTEDGYSKGWRVALENIELAWWPKNTWHNYVDPEEPKTFT